jgi:hypothetical protein
LALDASEFSSIRSNNAVDFDHIVAALRLSGRNDEREGGRGAFRPDGSACNGAEMVDVTGPIEPGTGA